MPRLLKDQPESLRPYLFHGVDLTWSEGDKDAAAEGPMCGDDRGKFGVKIANSKYQCFACGEKGNSTTFLQWLWDASDKTTAKYGLMAKSRGLANPDTLLHWGVVRSVFGGGWMVPGFTHKGNLQQLYKCSQVQGKMRLLPTPTMGHQLHGVNFPTLYDPDKPMVFLCEGPWDAMVLWETLGLAKETTGEDYVSGLVLTASEKSSLRANDNVLAVPGCNVFSETWLPLFAGKVVCLMYDSDHPRVHPKTGKQITPAGLTGTKRVAKILSSAKHPPTEINYLKWGVDGYDPDLISGYDVRDCLTASAGGLEQRSMALEGLLGRLAPVPQEWLSRHPRAATKGQSEQGGSQDLECLPCDSYSTMTLAWRKALKWTDGLDYALSIMLASVASTRAMGDQLWIKVVSPASSGKSTLCEAIGVNKEYVISKDTFTGLTSGYQTNDDGSENLSLVTKLRDKTLIINDGDTLLQLSNLPQVISQLRAFYGRNLRTDYKNKMSADHEGYNTTIILSGTSSMRKLDQSELGERFLDVVIMEKIDTELEDEVLWRVANRTDRNMSLEVGSDSKTQNEPELIRVMQLTGGYVSYLRENATAVMAATETPEWAIRQCTRMGKFVAYMRARPNYRQEETAEREFAARLVSQLVRLAKCLALVLNRDEVDEQVMERVKRVSLDTARGQTLSIASYLFMAEPKGCTIQSIALQISESEDKARLLLRFLIKIGVVRMIAQKSIKGKTVVSGTKRWRLTEELNKLYQDVLGVEE